MSGKKRGTKRAAAEKVEELHIFVENPDADSSQVVEEPEPSQPMQFDDDDEDAGECTEPIPARPKLPFRLKKRSRKEIEDAMPLITVKNVRIGSLKINHKRCIKSKEEVIDIEKYRAGAKLQSLTPIKTDHIRWLRIQYQSILKAVDKVKEGEEELFDLGDDLYIAVNVYGADVMTIVHMRYYFHGDDETKLFPSKNGISVQGEKFSELADALLSFEMPAPCNRVKLLVGQIVQEDIRDKLWDIAYKKKVPVEHSTNQLFVDRHIKSVMEEVEKNMDKHFKLYDSCVSYIQLPSVKGEDVFKFYYTDQMRKDLKHLTEVNENYHTASELLIETVKEDEKSK